MKSGLLIFLLASIQTFTLAQGEEIEFDRDYTSLLTSKIWKAGDERELVTLYKFNAGGTFFNTVILGAEFARLLGYQTTDSMGKWEWISHDTFTMQRTQTIINGEMKDLNPEPYHKAVHRIQQIDLQMIKGVSYNILENEDSEYVYPFKWVVKE
jgi:hypothetical protein